MISVIAHHLLIDAHPVSKQQATASPQFFCSAWCHVVWNIPLATWGPLSQLYPFPAYFSPQASSLMGWENGRAVDLVWALLNNDYNISVLSVLFS